VSPANSFGIMDGGIDRAIRDHFGNNLDLRVQSFIESHFHGEMPVGHACTISTFNDDIPLLIIAPTMRTPGNISDTLNAYIAFRAILLSVKDRCLDSIVCCGLGTGVGKMDPEDCARQMRMAYNQVKGSGNIPDYDELKTLDMILKGLGT
jgi:O-acetyl-ADP-ribose deacetylase (regulator of RNase III)